MSTLFLQQKSYSTALLQKTNSVVALIQLWMERQHQRSQLARLDPQQLIDMGLNRQQVKVEINKPFWK